MKRLALALLLLTGACTAQVPAGHRLANQDAAVAFVRAYFFIPDGMVPTTVEFSTPNCTDLGGLVTGIVDPSTDVCEWGVTAGDTSWISDRGLHHFSQTSLAHELMHRVVGDYLHANVATWGTAADGMYNGGRVGMANTALALHPDLDVMGEVVP